MSKLRFIVIGITDAPHPYFSPDVEAIGNGRVFSGGRRHHEIVAGVLPAEAEWVDITVPLDDVFEKYKTYASPDAPQSSSAIIVFASGDPLFFGFANTIRRKMPDAEIVLFPSFNSLQTLAHRLVLPYHDMHIVSLTGRPWPAFDRALIEQTPKIGVLTDREHTPAAIAERMKDYGYTNYIMHVGEHLGNPERERISTLTLAEASQMSFDYPNCLILCASCSSPMFRHSRSCLCPARRTRKDDYEDAHTPSVASSAGPALPAGVVGHWFLHGKHQHRGAPAVPSPANPFV